ncbi:hypothetical protein RJT34_32223 [Clitoria ternatea]|uniref:Uncharacterized protein n=1 Tax=Clitoria ternatea TaxID=43366 RepID=A0AAN9EVP5_CLITE
MTCTTFALDFLDDVAFLRPHPRSSSAVFDTFEDFFWRGRVFPFFSPINAYGLLFFLSLVLLDHPLNQPFLGFSDSLNQGFLFPLFQSSSITPRSSFLTFQFFKSMNSLPPRDFTLPSHFSISRRNS